MYVCIITTGLNGKRKDTRVACFCLNGPSLRRSCGAPAFRLNALRLILSISNAYPPYGLYILNRMGMDDYVLYIYPEDDIEARGEYLMYRCYPDFTAKRLAMARPTYSFPSKETDSVHTLSSSSSSATAPLPATPALSPSTTTPNDFADARGREPSSTDIVTNWKLLLADTKEKGLPVTFGFWMFVTDVRESMQDVMIRCDADHIYLYGLMI